MNQTSRLGARAYSNFGFEYIVYAWLLIIPFLNSPALEVQIFSLSGLKLSNIAAATLFIPMLLGSFKSRRGTSFERHVFFVLFCYLTVFTLEIYRSLGNLQNFHLFLPTVFPDSMISYLLSFYLRPIAGVIPLIVILRSAQTLSDVEKFMKFIGASVFLPSITFILAVAQNSAVLSGTRNGIAQLCESIFGFHYSDIGAIYITVGPILVLFAVRYGRFWIVNLLLAVLVVLDLRSRTTLVAFLFAGGLALLALRQRALLIGSAVMAALASTLLVLPTVTDLSQIGFVDPESSGLNGITSGRLNALWTPLLTQWFDHSSLLMFGAGRYGILASGFWGSSFIVDATHAHNAFIDLFLDVGAILFIVLVTAGIIISVRAYRFAKQAKSKEVWILLACLAGYLAGCMTEQTLFPAYNSAVVFPIVGCLLAIVKLKKIGIPRVNRPPVKAWPSAPARVSFKT